MKKTSTGPNKIRVAFSIPNFDTAGTGKALINIASGLNRDLFEPHIISLRDSGFFMSMVQQSGIPFHVFKFTTAMKPRIPGLIECWKISGWLKSQQFDIIHSFHYSADYSEALAATFAKTKWVFTKKNMNWAGKSHNAWRIRSRLATRIVVLNKQINSLFYSKSKKTNLIYRGIDLSEFMPREPDIRLQQSLSLDPFIKVILTVANLVPVKGIEYLLSAFANINNNPNHFKLVIVGDCQNDHGKKIIQMTEELGISQKVIFTGKRLDVSRFYNLASVFVIPSLKEAFSVVVSEAMASGVPVLASRVAGIKVQLQALPDQLFEPGDVGDLERKLRWIMAISEERRTSIINRQLNEVHTRFSIDKEVKLHEDLYLKIMGRTRN